MVASGVRISWASTIVSDVQPPNKLQQRPRKVKTHDQVTVSMPPFHGRYDPAFYIEWEFEINDIFVSHNFSERKRIQTAITTFTDFASLWWNEYCRSYPDYIPTTWNDLKLAMRYRFVPSRYTRDMVKKLQNLNQGSYTLREYYDTLETTLLYCFLEESEDDFVDRFWRGLNHDIQDIILHEELVSVDHLFCIACKAEQKIRRRLHKMNKSLMELPSSTMGLQGNNEGTDFVNTHAIDQYPVDITMPCDESVIDLITPLVLDDPVIALNVPNGQINEMSTVLSAAISGNSSSSDLSVPIADSSIEMSASTKIIDVTIEPCDLLVTSDLAHIKLVRHDEVINEFFHDISLWSITMDPPISVSQARNKIAEITCLKSVYIHDFTFNLIGDYGVDNDFLVHIICITCDKLACSREYKSVYIPNHFDMTSNFGINPVSNNLLQHCVF